MIGSIARGSASRFSNLLLKPWLPLPRFFDAISVFPLPRKTSTVAAEEQGGMGFPMDASSQIATLLDLGEATLSVPPEIPEVFGRLHSVYTGSSLDGPGLRVVFFLQGCAIRCQFCHQPDTWSRKKGSGKAYSSKEGAARMKSSRGFYRRNNGGITLSGGEPLLQPEFCAALAQEAHNVDLSVCIDTAGHSPHESWDMVLPHMDLVLFCPKSFDDDLFRELTGVRRTRSAEFVERVRETGQAIRFRHVLLPGLTDTDKEFDLIAENASLLPGFEAVELLPYHKLGVHRWESMGMDYSLADMRSVKKEEVLKAKERLEMRGLKTIANE